jgi:hypothetical protein
MTRVAQFLAKCSVEARGAVSVETGRASRVGSCPSKARRPVLQDGRCKKGGQKDA